MHNDNPPVDVCNAKNTIAVLGTDCQHSLLSSFNSKNQRKMYLFTPLLDDISGMDKKLERLYEREDRVCGANSRNVV